MELRVRLRYKSTSDFGKGDHLNFDKALAHALEWLYDEDQFEDERTWLYCMEGVLPIYIMMSIVTDIFTFALQDYAETNIKDYILRMEEGNYKHGWNDNKPSLLYLGDEIVLGRVHTFTSEVILWATYLYVSFRADIEEDNEKLKKAKNVLYKLFWKKTGLKEEFVKDTFLMKHFDQTIRDFAMDVLHRYKDDKPAADNKPKQTPVNNQMEESVLNYISPTEMRYYYEGWRNGKHGSICQRNGIYRFVEQAHGKSGILDDVKRKEEENPIVAIGIVAYWLQFNSRMDPVITRLTKYNCEIPKDIRELFDNYTEIRFKQFREEHRDDPNTLDWDWEYEFYVNTIIPHEITFNKRTEALFDYISDSDIALVRAVMNNYIKYLKKCRADKGYRVTPELLVLRAVDAQDDAKYEDLDDYEVNTFLDKLEGEGFIKVAWIEGHRPEGTRMLDKGRAYLKLLEKGGGVVGTKHAVREITWEEEKLCFKAAVLHVMEKKKEDGDYLFEKPTQWMAVYRFAIDIAIMYEMNDPKEPEDKSTPQYAAFEKFAHELQLDVNPPARLPFTKNAIDSINSNKSYVRYNTSYPWSKDGINDTRSFTLYTEMEDVYQAVQEKYDKFVRQAERSL
jgi:hypothetical protein